MSKGRLESIRSMSDYKKQARREPNIASAYRYLVQVWMIRILWRLNGKRRMGDFLNIDAEDVAAAIDLELEPDEKAVDAISGFRLSRRLREIENKAAPEDCALTGNLDLLQDALSLEKADRAILEFLLMIRKQPDLAQVAELLGNGFTLGDTVDTLSVILDLPSDEIKASLGRGGKLRTSGLIQVERRTSDLFNKLLVLNELLDAVSMRHERVMDILSTFVDAAPEPSLTPRDFEDYRSDYKLLIDHLGAALNDQREGCNVLVYGQPGIGKTELVRTLAKNIGVNLFEITAGNRDGEPLSTLSRLSAFQLTQQFLGKSRNNAILFDEVEDIFPNMALSWLTGKSESNARKGWINEQLERNKIPVFWLANNISHVDPAHLRRFDIVLKLRPMTSKARKKVLQAACRKHGLKNGAWVAKAAASPHLSPAVIEKVSRVVSSTKGQREEDDTAVFERVANGILDAMQLPPLKLNTSRPILPYSIDLIGADADLKSLIAGLSRAKTGRLLCYGPPGTGKTAFAKHVADELELPLLQFRASDILGPYVGMTERNIAQAFRQATEEGAIMLLDEIDSLLRSREDAGRSWEVTQVNELLVQMEDHPGVLIACTNFREGLDGAAARRFDMKVGFDYLSPDAAWTFFQKVLRYHKVNFGRQKPTVKRRVLALDRLTPGDFKASVRRLFLSEGGVQATSLAKALQSELLNKGPSPDREIGFMANI